MAARIVLTGPEVKEVVEKIQADPVEGFVMAWDKILRHCDSTWDSEESINPTIYAIPQAQWLEISEALMKHSLEWGLTWMNKGPSGF